MSIHEFDVVVIGAGPSGEVFAGLTADAGLKTAIVEQHLVAGECSYYACMPSKALLRPAEVLDEARRIPGVKESVSSGLDARSALHRRDEVIHDLDDSSQLPWLADHGIELFRGSGVIAGEREVRVGSEVLVANRAVVLATGSSASIPPVPGLAEAPIWNNRQGTTAKEVPPSLIILGGGPVGCELAQAWSSLGSKVTLIEREDRVLMQEEPFAGDLVDAAMREVHGVNLLTDTAVEAVRTSEDGVVVTAGGKEIEASELMVATGRRPRTDRVGLESVGLDSTKPLQTDDFYRVKGKEWLYAVGDVNGRAALTHMGKYQAHVAVQCLLGHEPSNRAEATGSPRVTFTNPQVAATGLTLSQALANGLDAIPVDVPTDSTAGASFTGKDTGGICRLVVDRSSSTIVGATFTGFEVAEWIHAATIAIVSEIPMDDLWQAVPPFPTRSEIWLRLGEKWDELQSAG